jgi:hypothetical protein
MPSPLSGLAESPIGYLGKKVVPSLLNLIP